MSNSTNKNKEDKKTPKITVILLNKPSEEAIKNLNKAYLNILIEMVKDGRLD